MAENKVIEDRENGFTGEFNQWHMFYKLCEENTKFRSKTLFDYTAPVYFDLIKTNRQDKYDQLKIRSSMGDGAKFINIIKDENKDDVIFAVKDQNIITTSYDSEKVFKAIIEMSEEGSAMQHYVEKIIDKCCGVPKIVDKTIYEMMHHNRELAKTLAPEGYFTPHKLDLLNTKHVDPDASIVLWYMQKFPERCELDGEYPFGFWKITFQDVVDAAKENFDDNHSEHDQRNYKVSCLVAKLDRALDVEGISNPIFEAIHDNREVNIENVDIKPIGRNFQNNQEYKFRKYIKNTLVEQGMDKKEANALVEEVYKNPKRDAVKDNKNTGKAVIQKPVDKKI